MKNFKSFKQWLKESKTQVSEGSSGDPKKNDSHEILTAYLCTRRLSYIKELGNIKGNDNILKELQQIHDDIKSNPGKIVGASEAAIESIIQYDKKEEAFAQAISAAIAILEKNNLNEAGLKNETEVKRPVSEMSEGVKKVILTGDSWDSSVKHFSGIEALKKFDVESYGMKDFNSSDIILVGDKQFLGVSLKKTGDTKSSQDPTLINRSFMETLPENVNDMIANALNETFNEILNNNAKKLIGSADILDTILKKLPTMLSNKGVIKETYKNFITANQINAITTSNDPKKELEKFLIDKCEKSTGDMWKIILSSSYGLMCTHDNKEVIRKVVNPILSDPNSKYKTAITKVLKDENVANKIAVQLFGIIFKADADHGLINLKKYNFDFGLCTGKGSYKKSKGGFLSVGKAEYESIETVTTVLQKLRKQGQPVLEPASSDGAIYTNKSNATTVSLFYTLKIGSIPVANIMIRYKGDYISSPTFLATMTPELKNEFKHVDNIKIEGGEDKDSQTANEQASAASSVA